MCTFCHKFRIHFPEKDLGDTVEVHYSGTSVIQTPLIQILDQLNYGNDCSIKVADITSIKKIFFFLMLFYSYVYTVSEIQTYGPPLVPRGSDN